MRKLLLLFFLFTAFGLQAQVTGVLELISTNGGTLDLVSTNYLPKHTHPTGDITGSFPVQDAFDISLSTNVVVAGSGGTNILISTISTNTTGMFWLMIVVKGENDPGTLNSAAGVIQGAWSVPGSGGGYVQTVNALSPEHHDGFTVGGVITETNIAISVGNDHTTNQNTLIKAWGYVRSSAMD
jgi:hypothetical protein